jgi:hypothetical protein
MTPKEKAKDLVFKKFGCSKQYALIAVEEILNSIVWHYFEGSAKAEDNWWREVKQEIEKL